MDKQAIKDLTYGGLIELMRNNKYYYYSQVGANFCHWTDAGKEALAEYMNIVGHKMLEAEKEELDQRAKNMVLTTLKGEVT